MSVLSWVRRLVVSLGIGVTSYIFMLIIMVLSVIYDRQMEPVITYAFYIGHGIVGAVDSVVSGSHWGQVAANHLRERVNMTHVVLSLPAIILATFFIGIPLNSLLGGTRTALQRIMIALFSIPTTVILAVALFTFNVFFPDLYASFLRFADWVWQGTLNTISASGDTIPGARKLANAARQGFSGHHYVIMAVCSMIASFIINAIFVATTRGRDQHPYA